MISGMENIHHEQHTMKLLHVLREDEHFGDVTIVSENQQFVAHYFLLSMRSSFFRQILEANQHHHSLHNLKDIKVSHMEPLLDFI